jgi:hypothetical protein
LSPEWQHVSGWNAPTLKVLVRVGLAEFSKDYQVRLTEKGVWVQKRLPPEPRPDWHDPEWQRVNWKLDYLPEPYKPTENEKKVYGWA